MTKKMIVLCVSIFLFAVCLTSCQNNDAVNTPDKGASTTVSTVTSVSTAATTTEATAATTATTPPTKPTTTTVKPTTTTMTTVSTTEDWRKYYTSKQILNDNTFQNGFHIIDQVTTASEGVWKNTDSTADASWQIAQWGTFKSYDDRSSANYISLWRDRLDTAQNILTNGFNTVIYDDAKKSLTLSMNSIASYNGLPHTDNSTWPHLLIQQGIIGLQEFRDLPKEEKQYYSLAADKMILTLDIRLTSFKHVPTSGGINACQFVSFYYVVSENNDGFVWFGVPLFDDRSYSESEKSKFVIDIGSNLYMYGVPMVDVFKSTREDGRYDFYKFENIKEVEASEQWMHIELDLKPYLDTLASRALNTGDFSIYNSTADISQLYLGGMNMGYEVHGSYDVTFELMNYALTAYVKK